MATVPADWTEILNTPDNMDKLEEAIAILADSFPAGQYAQPMHRMIKAMIPRKINGYYLMNLRVFLHDHDIAAFFFLRKRFVPMAYCLSPGALQSVDADKLYDQLFAICSYMKAEKNNPGLDIVSEINPPTFKYDNMQGAFQTALTPPQSPPPQRLSYRGIIQPGDPWPNRLFRWEIVNLT